jgi:hypothetical protein
MDPSPLLWFASVAASSWMCGERRTRSWASATARIPGSLHLGTVAAWLAESPTRFIWPKPTLYGNLRDDTGGYALRVR